MKSVMIGNKKYGFSKDVKNNKEIRTSFNRLTQDIYGFSFEPWYQNGYWGDRYIPYVLLDGEKVVSNVSVNKMDFLVEGKKKRGIQIGTVMTDKEYTKKGLNRFIMEQVLEDWKDSADFIYLFANDEVLDFYPKFNFVAVDEYRHSKPLAKNDGGGKIKKLNMEDQGDRLFLMESINKSLPVAKLAMRDNASLIMFYCTSFMKHNIYYLEKYETIVIAEFDKGVLYINDVFSKKSVDLEDIIKEMADKDTVKVVLGFTPLEETGYDINLLKEEDTTLFVLRDQAPCFLGKSRMFPVLSHA